MQIIIPHMKSIKEKTLDRIDAKILKCLVANAKISTADLAKSVGLSTSPCWQRVRRLEADGYITGYTAKLDQYKLGATEIVFVEVSLERHNQDALKEFGNTIQKIDEVLEVFLTTGEHDYLLKVAVTGTRGYEDFLINTLSKIPGIRQTRSSFALRCLKNADVFIP
jgi:Lrp/AsnC family transcriptional regulator, leucine-responsive regulatory protein